MSKRRDGGRETWNRLREFDKGQADAERLAAGILSLERYTQIDPAHPLGGPDGGTDIKCSKDGRVCRAAAYFPRGQQKPSAIRKKFCDDLAKAQLARAEEFIFITNQELRLQDRADLVDLAKPLPCTILHLERIASLLDTPDGYPVRLEFLQIEMTREEQLAFFNNRDQVIFGLVEKLSSRSKASESSTDLQTVRVEDPNARDAYGSALAHLGYAYRSKLMECKACEEIFRVTREPDIFGLARSTFLREGDLKTVTCPACGKVQKYKD